MYSDPALHACLYCRIKYYKSSLKFANEFTINVAIQLIAIQSVVSIYTDDHL